MQFTQKKIINIIIAIAVMGLIMVPVVALFKSFVNEENEVEMTPQIIERDEIVEEIEYVDSAITPTVPSTFKTNTKIEIEEEDDDD